MSKVDTAWLRMERSTNLMMITGVIGLAGTLSIEALKACLADRFLAYRRFRQRAVDDGHQAWWETDPEFDLDWHVRRTGLPRPGGRAELEELVSQLASTPLDPSKPRWQFHLVDEYAGGSAIICRLHHCYADGMAMVQVMLSLTDSDAARSRRRSNASKQAEPPLWERWLAPAREGIEHVAAASEQLVRLLGEWALHPTDAMSRLSQMALHGAEESTGMLRELLHSLTLPDDPPTALRQELGVRKRVAWCDPIPLDEVKALGKALGCTVNDVLLAAVTGALHQHLAEAGEVPASLQIRASVPVNLRPRERARELGNHFGLVFLDLPIGESNPVARLRRVAQSMRELKGSRQAAVSYGLLNALGAGPVALQAPALDQLSRKATAVATNVPGPVQPLYLAGERIDSMMFWVPQTGQIGLGVSILSYAGRVYFGLIADQHCLAEPQAVVEAFAPELEKLVLLALMSEDGEHLDAEAAEVLLSEASQGSDKG
ncbi:MAG: wax ester/triacylglycerol synthase family O-acyltransferase [Lysobacterales bacterium]